MSKSTVITVNKLIDILQAYKDSDPCYGDLPISVINFDEDYMATAVYLDFAGDSEGWELTIAAGEVRGKLEPVLDLPRHESGYIADPASYGWKSLENIEKKERYE